jgi:N-acetylmuramoyl-L-alanine amidase
VVIDPGHGGIDPGAKGRSGTIEKDITLEFSERLREMLGKNSGFRLEMTRDKDVFLRLDERVRIARQYEADLLISVHADTIRFKDIRGATVYTISDKASDSLAQEIADGENKADEIAGMTIADEAEGVADILIDLARRETQTLSIGVAQKVVSSLKGEVELINNPHRFAGFRVLRAPDVPSILLELGYLSNPQDEALLKNDSWRDNVAEKLAEAVEAYAKMVRSTAQVAP